MVCGESDWSVSELRKTAEIRFPPSTPCIGYLWEALFFSHSSNQRNPNTPTFILPR